MRIVAKMGVLVFWGRMFFHVFLSSDFNLTIAPFREGEGQRIRNRVVQKMKHRAELKEQAVARGESVVDWDRILLVGKKIK